MIINCSPTSRIELHPVAGGMQIVLADSKGAFVLVDKLPPFKARNVGAREARNRNLPLVDRSPVADHKWRRA